MIWAITSIFRPLMVAFIGIWRKQDNFFMNIYSRCIPDIKRVISLSSYSRHILSSKYTLYRMAE